MLLGDVDVVLVTLKKAASYAQKLELQASVINYMGWEDATEKPLCLSRDRQMLEYLGTSYEPAQNRFQMDLFMDSPITAVLNAIVKALGQRNPDEADKQLHQLEEMDSNHPQIEILNVLLKAQRNLYEPVVDINDELETLEQHIVPLAEDVLRHEARDFLAQHWWKLAEVLQGIEFDPKTPKLHSSYVSAHAYDWNSVRTSIEWEDDWYQHPVLLIRHVKACTMLRYEPAAYLSVFRLCWHYPEQLVVAFSGNTPSGLKQQWQLFEDNFEELDVESFPAWYLMSHSGLVSCLPAQIESEEELKEKDDEEKESEENLLTGLGKELGKGYRSYQLIYSLLQVRHATSDNENNDAEMFLRKQLQETNPQLLKIYIRS